MRANLQVYADLARDAWLARRWSDKLRVWCKPPGWRPADVAARWPKPAFAVDTFERYDPPALRSRQAIAFSADNAHAYVLNRDLSVAVVDRAKNAVISTMKP